MRASRRTVIVQGPLAFRMHRLTAADRGTLGVQLTTLPLLAARLAGGFYPPAPSGEIQSSLQSALAAGGFSELEPSCGLPGEVGSAARSSHRGADGAMPAQD